MTKEIAKKIRSELKKQMPDTIYTNDKNFRAMMLKCGYTNEDIRQVHLKELHDNGICVLTF